MKIAVLGIRGLPANYSGFETCADHTSRHWTESGHDVLVYCRRNRYKEKPTHYHGVNLRYTPQLPFKGIETLSHTFLSILDLCFLNRQYKYVHLYNVGNSLFVPFLKIFGKKVLVSVDGIEWKRDKWGKLAKAIYRIGEMFAIRFANETIVDNQEISNYYLKKYGKDTTLIAYGAKIIEANESISKHILEKYGLRKGEYFIFVGRLVPEKGAHDLVATYKKLDTPYPLVVIGDDHSNSEYKKELLSNESDSIKMLGFKFGEEYEQLLANALIYLSASKLEGTSPSLLAAMGAGVCSLVNGIPENKTTVNESAYTYEENNLGDLLACWDSLLKNPREIQSMALKGKDHVIKNYSWSNIAEDYVASFEKIS